MKKIQFTLNQNDQEFDTLLVGAFDNGTLVCSEATLASNDELKGALAELIELNDFDGKAGSQIIIRNTAGFKRILLVGFGKAEKISPKAYIEIVAGAAKALQKTGAVKLQNALIIEVAGQDSDWAAFQSTLQMQTAEYQYQHQSRGEFSALNTQLESVNLATTSESAAAQVAQAQASAIGMALTQDLANTPANYCTPTFLAETAQALASDYGFEVNILDKAEMIEMGMGSFMSVAQGSAQPPKMICLSYKGGNDEQAPIAFVGKGVTFDTGGISLKPGLGMDEMKYDMGGAATVLGLFKALGELKPAINVVGVIASTENMPSSTAVKPGDVVTSLSGQTIEVLNTDAEGRLILCDALTYAQQTYQPKQVIDIATLTGACIIALGHHVSGLLGNNQALADQLIAAGNQTYDRFWQLPMGEEWDEQLKSNFADIANIGDRSAGTITAAQFLGRFTKDVEWAHLDIAGTAWKSGANKGATGRPVAALVEFLNSQA